MEKGSKKGAEELEGLMGGLKLTEEERRALKGAWLSEVREAGRPAQAVSKLFSTKSGFAEGMAQALGKIWCPVKGIRCKDLGDNLFLFTFLQPGGKKRAITEGPWEFGGDLLIVVEFDETKRLKDLEFTHIPVWIRVFNLPLGLMNESTGRLIGEKVGKSLEVDTDEEGSAVGNFLRIKALIDVRKPLVRGVMMEDGQGEPNCWCNFKYEFLPNFCYSYGLLGHVEKECDGKVWKEDKQQFGDWMRARAKAGVEWLLHLFDGADLCGCMLATPHEDWMESPR
ncbi:hypothetical protein E2562_035741 [Oryza meyeriana var. granulata]|uniref:Zinc knuckle CX2CX4HX4C domain-containing protein n=1 Tax=Oryza meyeriana var. granulata TaxID=110450 RepID=A0A6G1E7A7_9ORYZ|nr:hypothetical protein E2562_035741 [Oryza meyeriana var. granulata]